jgi:hypothetical protein
MTDDQIPAGGDRRGVDTGLLAVTQSLVGEAEKRAKAYETAHRREHEEFEAAHRREHEELEKSHSARMTARNLFLAERDQRYGERFQASQEALKEASLASKEAIEAALKAAKEAVDKSEASVTKAADATFVKIENLREDLAGVMPRLEAENRLGELARRMDECTSQITGVASQFTALASGLASAKSLKTESSTSLRDNAGLIVAILALLLVLARDFFR